MHKQTKKYTQQKLEKKTHLNLFSIVSMQKNLVAYFDALLQNVFIDSNMPKFLSLLQSKFSLDLQMNKHQI